MVQSFNELLAIYQFSSMEPNTHKIMVTHQNFTGQWVQFKTFYNFTPHEEAADRYDSSRCGHYAVLAHLMSDCTPQVDSSA